MRLYTKLIQSFLLIYLCYCHDLNHADPTTVKQSKSSVPIDSLVENIETTNTQNLRKTVHESNQNDQQIQYTTPSVDISSQNRVPVSTQNDLTSPSTPVQTEQQPRLTEAPPITDSIKNIPILNDQTNPKIIHNDIIPPVQTQINTQSTDGTLQETLSIPKHTHQQEQIKVRSDHIPSLSNTQQPISDTQQNSKTLDLKPDQHSQIPLKPTETMTNDNLTEQNESHIPTTTTSKTLRSSTSSKLHKKIHTHPRHVRANQQQTEDNSTADVNQTESSIVQQSNDEQQLLNGSLSKLEEVPVNTTQRSGTDIILENKTQTTDENSKPDVPGHVYISNPKLILDYQNISSTKEGSNKSENLTLNQEIDNSTTTVSSHLPRSIIDSTTEIDTNNTNETDQHFSQTSTKIEDNNNSISLTNNSDQLLTNKNRQICWHLPHSFQPSIELLENQLFRIMNIFPEFLRTIFFGRIDDREILMNTMWFSSICTMCFLFSFLFLTMGTKRLKQSKHEKEVRARCQQLQQYNNQIELERATFERQNQKLSDEIDELKNVPARDADEDIFALREECTRFLEDLKTARSERDSLQQDIDYKQNLLQKHEYDMQRQVDTVAHLNNELLQLKQKLETERGNAARLQSNDLSLERFENFQETIQQLKSEITQLKQDKFTQKDQLQEIQGHTNQLEIENNQLTLRMKQLKTLLEQRDQTIKHIHQKISEEKTPELESLLSILTDNSSNNNQHLLSTIDNDVEKSNQHIRDLHHDIDEKTRRIKELDVLFKQEKDRCKEIETKLKVVLELRERDTHLHIRQLGQTDAELRKARTDTERVRILQQQLELKQQQLDDVQKVLATEQIKFNEECSKSQREVHEKWMEIKRLVRELDASKKECEGLRKQITKHANNGHSPLDKTMIKPLPQHFGNGSEVQTNGSSPTSYQQGEKPIDHQRNDSGATSPAEMFMPRPPLFGMSRPPFFPAPFMHHPHPNPFMLHPRFPMPPGGPHGMISPISHLIINGNDANNSEIIDSSNITPNSISHDVQSNETAGSPILDNEKQIKVKKPKKSLKKKTRTSVVKEDV